MNILENNPYKDAYIIDYKDGDISLERKEFLPILVDNPNIKTHTVLEGETIQSIAYKYYGDSGLWYRIADVNSIYNPFIEIYEGVQLYIP